MSPYFSIIIPTLNEEQYLPNILGDLARQEEKNFEVVIVDGRSDDKTQLVALSFQKKFPLTFITAGKRNVSFQRNLGASKAGGQVFIFLDADTRVEKDFTRILTGDFQKKHAQLLLPTIIPDDKSKKAKFLISFVNSLIRASQYYGRPLATGGNFFVEKKTFLKIGGFNEDVYISEDHEFIHRAYKKGIKARILKTPKVVVSMRRGKLEGDASLIYKYIVGFVMYTMNPSEKSLKTKLFDYQMGGHLYDKKSSIRQAQGKNKKSKVNMEKLKQFLQLGVVVALLKFFK